MFARPGDRIAIGSRRVGGHRREGDILEVDRVDGAPPYLVRWSDTRRESLLFPGDDAHVEHRDDDRAEPARVFVMGRAELPVE